MSHRVLVDTSAYYALTDSTERTHEMALGIQRRLVVERWQLFTTSFILAEIHALLLHRLGYHPALRVLQDIERSTTTVVRPALTDEQRARAILITYDDKAFSLTDSLSFAVMEQLDISSAFTFDRHFSQYGFPTLTPA